MKNIVLQIIEKMGYSVLKISKNSKGPHPDINEVEFWQIYNFCKPYTMTSVERMYALYCSVKHILKSDIKGDFVECGTWRGGSSMMIAQMLVNHKISDRKIYLYDTFEGMSEPTAADINYNGKKAFVMLKETEHIKASSVWCLADLSDVKHNMSLTNFPSENLVYIKGKVEVTIPETIPNENIALLRLDTDWYESTKHELTYLFPRLGINGILIIDDYGHWEGCRKAVDEYLEENKISILLNRIDYTGRIGVKTIANR